MSNVIVVVVQSAGDVIFAGLIAGFAMIAVLVGLFFVLHQLYYHNLSIHTKMRYWAETRKRRRFHERNS